MLICWNECERWHGRECFNVGGIVKCSMHSLPECNYHHTQNEAEKQSNSRSFREIWRHRPVRHFRGINHANVARTKTSGDSGFFHALLECVIELAIGIEVAFE